MIKAPQPPLLGLWLWWPGHGDDTQWARRAAESASTAPGRTVIIYDLGGSTTRQGGAGSSQGGGIEVRQLASDQGHEARAFLSAIVDEYERPGAAYVAAAWHEYFGAHLGPLPRVLAAPCCAEFVASGTVIRQHPKSFYVGALAWLDATQLGPKQAARALEYLWHLIFQASPEVRVPEATCLCTLYGTPRLPLSPQLPAVVLVALAAGALAAARALQWRRRRRPTA